MPRAPHVPRSFHLHRLLPILLTLALVSPNRTRADCSPPGGVHINQVRFFDRGLPDDGRVNPLVELFNKGPSPIALDGYVVTSADRTIKTTLPAVSLPAGAFLEVRFETGTDDLDFGDRVGAVYTNTDSVDVFVHAADAVALYDAPGGNLVDFMAWSSSGAPPSGPAYDDAVAGGKWTSGDFVGVDPLEPLSTLRLLPDGYDNDSSDDWSHLGWSDSRYGAAVPGPNEIQTAPENGTAIPIGEIHFDWDAVSAAMSYRLVVATDAAFTTVVKDTIVFVNHADLYLTDPQHFWKVEVTDGCGPIAGATAWSFIDESLLPPGPKTAPGEPVRILAFGVLGVVREFQHKDSRLLCLYDSGDNGAFPPVFNRRRPGCTEAAGDAGPWDDAHPARHAAFTKVVAGGGLFPRAVNVSCPHCQNYCARACVAMLNHYYGGDLMQDRISYQFSVSGGFAAVHPEEDLGHDRPAMRAGTQVVLPWALDNSQIVGNNTATAPTYAQLKASIVAGFPVMAGVQGHVFIVDGYCDANSFMTRAGPLPATNMIHVADPWPTGMTPWQNYTNVAFTGYWQLAQAGAAAIVGHKQEATVTTDSDGDGVMDFDEGGQTHPPDRPRLLQSDPNMTDTGMDEVNDKQEIRAYTFHRLDHPAHNAAQVNAFNFADLDGDGLRAEADCDGDGDGDFDGGEDINGNGVNPGAGETCMFDAASKSIDFSTNKISYSPVEHVLPLGGTYHGSSSYSYYIFQKPPNDCSFSIAINTPYTGFFRTGTVFTDPNGNLFPSDFGTFPPGCYFAFLDIGHDGKFGNIVRRPGGDVAENCDLTTAFTVDQATAAEVSGPFLESVSGDVRVQWSFSAGAGAGDVTIERAAAAAGPWTPLATIPASPSSGPREFDDHGLTNPGVYFYRLRVGFASGERIFGPARIEVVEPPLELAAIGNPVRGAARFAVRVPRSGTVELDIYDGQGRRIRNLFTGWSRMGPVEFAWDGRNDHGAALSSGTYFVRVNAASRDRTAKFVFLR
jgi:hypothetical protein